MCACGEQAKCMHECVCLRRPKRDTGHSALWCSALLLWAGISQLTWNHAVTINLTDSAGVTGVCSHAWLSTQVPGSEPRSSPAHWAISSANHDRSEKNWLGVLWNVLVVLFLFFSLWFDSESIWAGKAERQWVWSWISRSTFCGWWPWCSGGGSVCPLSFSQYCLWKEVRALLPFLRVNTHLCPLLRVNTPLITCSHSMWMVCLSFLVYLVISHLH